jgi:hypothetical protein
MEWPEPGLRKEWKEAIQLVCREVLAKWYRKEVTGSRTGRRVEYGNVRDAETRIELLARATAAPLLAQQILSVTPSAPAPFTRLSLSPHEVSAITRMRCHMMSCIRTHCGHQAHTLRHNRYHPIQHWHQLKCVFCNMSCIDSNTHFLLHCPFYNTARAAMLHAIHIAVMRAGAGFRWADYD